MKLAVYVLVILSVLLHIEVAGENNGTSIDEDIFKDSSTTSTETNLIRQITVSRRFNANDKNPPVYLGRWDSQLRRIVSVTTKPPKQKKKSQRGKDLALNKDVKSQVQNFITEASKQIKTNFVNFLTDASTINVEPTKAANVPPCPMAAYVQGNTTNGTPMYNEQLTTSEEKLQLNATYATPTGNEIRAEKESQDTDNNKATSVKHDKERALKKKAKHKRKKAHRSDSGSSNIGRIFSEGWNQTADAGAERAVPLINMKLTERPEPVERNEGDGSKSKDRKRYVGSLLANSVADMRSLTNLLWPFNTVVTKMSTWLGGGSECPPCSSCGPNDPACSGCNCTNGSQTTVATADNGTEAPKSTTAGTPDAPPPPAALRSNNETENNVAQLKKSGSEVENTTPGHTTVKPGAKRKPHRHHYRNP